MNSSRSLFDVTYKGSNTGLSQERLRYRAVWRSNHLIILPIDCHPFRQSVSAVMEGNHDRLLACLKHSPVKRLLLSNDLPIEELLSWVELGSQARVPVFLKRTKKIHNRQVFPARLFNRFLDIVVASFLLLLFSPVILISSLILISLHGKAFERRWCLRQTGRFYSSLYIGSTQLSLPPWCKWITDPRVSQSPHLINILLGHNSFMDSSEAVNYIDTNQPSQSATI